MSKFNGTSNSNAQLFDGTLDVYLNSIKSAGLTPGLPLKTNASRTLVSEKIQLTDIDAVLLTNPLVGTLTATDFETDDYFSVNSELQKIDNFTASTATDTNLTGLLKVPEVATDRIYDSTQATWIGFDGSDISVNANDLTLNGFSVLTEQSPLPDNSELEQKTQNISLATTGTKTTMVQDLDISAPPTGLTVDGVIGQGEDRTITGSQTLLIDGKQGFTFTLDYDIVVSRIKVREGARINKYNGFMGYWYRDPPSTEWMLGLGSSMTGGSTGNTDGFSWSENGYPRTLSANNGRIHAFVLDVGIGGRISDGGQSPLTYGPGVNIIGRCYEAEPNFGTFPAIQTTDGYAPVCSFEYADNSPSFSKKLTVGIIDNKNGTIINVRDPVNLQDVATKNYVDTRSLTAQMTNIMRSQNFRLSFPELFEILIPQRELVLADASKVFSAVAANSNNANWKSFDGIYGKDPRMPNDGRAGGWTTFLFSTIKVDNVDTLGGWLYLDLNSFSTTAIITSFQVYAADTYFPVEYHFIASNDQVNWTSLYYTTQAVRQGVINHTNSTQGTAYTPKRPLLLNDEYYRYVGIIVKNSVFNNAVHIQELLLWGTE